jgi:hypothetical protein
VNEDREVVRRLNAIDAKLALILSVAIEIMALALGVVGYFLSRFEWGFKRPYAIFFALALLTWASLVGWFLSRRASAN